MDRNYYYQRRAQEHQVEITKELATSHMLNEANRKPLSTKQVRRLIFRIAPALIVIGILLLHFLT